jgi:hypothetical protein
MENIDNLLVDHKWWTKEMSHNVRNALVVLVIAGVYNLAGKAMGYDVIESASSWVNSHTLTLKIRWDHVLYILMGLAGLVLVFTPSTWSPASCPSCKMSA